MRSVLLPRYHPVDIFRFALDRQIAGERIVLVVIEAVSGASVRPIGTPMVVCETGIYAGYVSNGCVDADIARHALAALDTGTLSRLTYGPGSPYMDIQLPCGGGVSLVIIPQPDMKKIAEICRRFDARESLGLSLQTGLAFGDTMQYAPPLRILAAGRGENLLMLVRGAQSLGVDCAAYSPDESDVKQISEIGGMASCLTFGTAPNWSIDARTAIVTLFHDHDYEIPILRSALQSEAFYIGAMGSRATHEKRVALLKQAGLDTARLRGPIGLVPSMRDAGRLAISVLAEIIAQEGAPF